MIAILQLGRSEEHTIAALLKRNIESSASAHTHTFRLSAEISQQSLRKNPFIMFMGQFSNYVYAFLDLQLYFTLFVLSFIRFVC